MAESLTKGHYLNAHLSRWVPNLILGAFGVAALVWRARVTSARLPFTIPIRFTRAARALPDTDSNGAGAVSRSHPIQAEGRRRRHPNSPLRGAVAEPARSIRGPGIPAGRRHRVPGPARSVLHLHVPGQVGQDLQGSGYGVLRRRAARLHDAAVRLLRHPDRRAPERPGDVRRLVANERAHRHEGVRDQSVPHGAPRHRALTDLQQRHLRPRAVAARPRQPAGRGPRRADSRTAAAHLRRA